MILGAIEAGGTKFVCAIGDEEGNVMEKVSFSTTTPDETMENVINYFKDKNIEALGVGSFGPIDPNKDSKTYGYITTTPKKYWSNYNILGRLKESFDIPMEFDTDVNGAALGEITWGSAKGTDNCLYITVGTGIGAGAIVDGKILHGLSHPEMGHILISREEDDNFDGTCIYHKTCLEGLACGPAIEQRWGKNGYQLGENHPCWDLEARYLAKALVSYILILSPKKIIMGGGVMKQLQLFPLIRSYVKKYLNGYVSLNTILEEIDSYIIPPGLGDNAGIKGALALAKIATNN